MTGRAFVVVASVMALSIGAVCASGETGGESGKDSIYSYADDDMPAVFFFPPEKARWDGTKVTMSEWYALTEVQKEKFIAEYLDELKRRNSIDFDVFGIEYLKALNAFSYYSNEKAQREPSTKFIDLLLEGQGKMSKDAGQLPEGKR